MILLSLIPTSFLIYFVNMIFYAGVIATVLGFVLRFQFLAPYRSMCQVLGILLLGAGLYFKGGYEVEQQWRAKAEAFQKKVDIAEQKSNTANAEIQTKIVTKKQIVHDTKVITKQVIVEVAKEVDSECKITPQTVEILNAAATNKPAAKLNLDVPKEEAK